MPTDDNQVTTPWICKIKAFQQLQMTSAARSCKVCLTSNDDANDDAEQSQGTAKDFYHQDLDEQS